MKEVRSTSVRMYIIYSFAVGEIDMENLQRVVDAQTINGSCPHTVKNITSVHRCVYTEFARHEPCTWQHNREETWECTCSPSFRACACPEQMFDVQLPWRIHDDANQSCPAKSVYSFNQDLVERTCSFTPTEATYISERTLTYLENSGCIVDIIRLDSETVLGTPFRFSYVRNTTSCVSELSARYESRNDLFHIQSRQSLQINECQDADHAKEIFVIPNPNPYISHAEFHTNQRWWANVGNTCAMESRTSTRVGPSAFLSNYALQPKATVMFHVRVDRMFKSLTQLVYASAWPTEGRFAGWEVVASRRARTSNEMVSGGYTIGMRMFRSVTGIGGYVWGDNALETLGTYESTTLDLQLGTTYVFVATYDVEELRVDSVVTQIDDGTTQYFTGDAALRSCQTDFKFGTDRVSEGYAQHYPYLEFKQRNITELRALNIESALLQYLWVVDKAIDVKHLFSIAREFKTNHARWDLEIGRAAAYLSRTEWAPNGVLLGLQQTDGDAMCNDFTVNVNGNDTLWQTPDSSACKLESNVWEAKGVLLTIKRWKNVQQTLPGYNTPGECTSSTCETVYEGYRRDDADTIIRFGSNAGIELSNGEQYELSTVRLYDILPSLTVPNDCVLDTYTSSGKTFYMGANHPEEDWIEFYRGVFYRVDQGYSRAADARTTNMEWFRQQFTLEGIEQYNL